VVLEAELLEKTFSVPSSQMDPGTGERQWTFRLAAPSTESGVLTTRSNVLFAGGRDGSSLRSMLATASCCGRQTLAHRSPPGP
jgi:hypothetical protein